MNIEVKCLKIFIKIETLLGFSRHFVTWRFPVKCIVLFRILAESILALYTLQCIHNVNSFIQSMLTSLFKFSSVLLSCYYSKTFLKFLGYINRNHIHYKSDNVYRRRLTVILKLGICAWGGYVIFLFGLVLEYFINIDFKASPNFKTVLIHLNKVSTNLSYHLEFAFQYCLLGTISEQLQCIVRCVKKEGAKDYSTTVIEMDSDGPQNLSHTFQEWGLLYSNVTKSCKLFNTIYGVQMTMSIFVFIAFYVSNFYSLISVGLKGTIRTDIIRITVIYTGTVFSMTLVTMVTRSAQDLKNSASKLTRGLQQLHVRLCSLADSTEQKELRQFLRVISSRPINIITFGTVNVNMALIPACVSIIASSTILALQFNNVL